METRLLHLKLRKKFGLGTELRGRVVKPHIIIYYVKDANINVYPVLDCRSDCLSLLGFATEFDYTDDTRSSYSKEFRQSVIKEYIHASSLRDLRLKYNILDSYVLPRWVLLYNKASNSCTMPHSKEFITWKAEN
ncbi:MAG: hypothetical protein LBE09_01665 [Christensenellaceae bacterium]|jgi:hypothetical protein|nr:hypothetical protein [Christensenellaceae bacterium]